jgi:hypothetical protein
MAVVRKRKPRPNPRPNPTPRANPPQALPFNPQIAAARRKLFADRMGYLRDYGRQVSDLNTQATSQLRALDIQQPDVNRGILNNFAGRGLAYSSGYGTTLGDATADFQAQRSDINNALGSNIARMRSDRRATMSDYQYQLGNLNQRAASAAIPRAGSLGFNRTPTKKVKKRNRRVI